MTVLQDIAAERTARLLRLGRLPDDISWRLTSLERENARLETERSRLAGLVSDLRAETSYLRRVADERDQRIAELNELVTLDQSVALRGAIYRILEIVATFYQLKLSDLVTDSRIRMHARPRQMAIFLCRKHTKGSLCAIGRVLNRDHTTIVHSVDKINQLLATDEKIRSDLSRLEEVLNAANNSRSQIDQGAVGAGTHGAGDQ